LRSSDPGLRMTGMRSCRNLSCLFESVVMMVYVYVFSSEPVDSLY
jgi:hypothetical protein